MISSSVLENAGASASKFFLDMAEWEEWCAGFDINQPSEVTHEVRLARLKAIFNKYLSSKAIKHNQSRYEFLDFEMPPEFSHGISGVEAAEGGKVWVYKPTGMMDGRVRFLMVNEDGTWKVAYREDDVANSGNWRKAVDL